MYASTDVTIRIHTQTIYILGVRHLTPPTNSLGRLKMANRYIIDLHVLTHKF